MGRLRKLCALALLLCGTGAFGSMNDGRPPTVADAHEFLRDAFTRYAIGYVLWHGPGTRDYYKGWSVYYGGNGCASEFGGADPSSRIFAVDWSLISSVQTSGSQAIYVVGQLHRPARFADRPNYANFHLNLPDPGLARSVTRAMDFLRASCVRRTKFD
jgi:hypothetical protein